MQQKNIQMKKLTGKKNIRIKEIVKAYLLFTNEKETRKETKKEKIIKETEIKNKILTHLL